MKALTLTQPWATLVAIGAKRIETRSWSTAYRGPIVIHAAKGQPAWSRDLALDQPFKRKLQPAGYGAQGRDFDDGTTTSYEGRPLPLGAIVAVGELVWCRRIPHNSEPHYMRLFRHVHAPDELEFGDFTAERFAWRLENVVAVEPPVECRGAQGLWDLPAHVDLELLVNVATGVVETRYPGSVVTVGAEAGRQVAVAIADLSRRQRVKADRRQLPARAAVVVLGRLICWGCARPIASGEIGEGTRLVHWCACGARVLLASARRQPPADVP